MNKPLFMDKFNIQFKDYMESLTIREHREMVQKIAQECFVPRNRVSLWKNGHCRITPIYRKEICRIIGRDIFADTAPLQN